MLFNDEFLKEVIDNQRARNGIVVQQFTKELSPVEKPPVMIAVPLELLEDVLEGISRGHDHTDESLELYGIVEEFKKTL